MIEQLLSKDILHRSVSHPHRVEFKEFGQGVAVVIFNQRREILLLQEKGKDDAYGRRAGQWNILTETREPGELVKTTVVRGLWEELGKSYEEFVAMSGTYRETNATYLENFDYKYKYRCICLLFTGDPDSLEGTNFYSPTNEISRCQWVASDDLNQFDIEDGALLVIEYYQKANSLVLAQNFVSFSFPYRPVAEVIGQNTDVSVNF